MSRTKLTLDEILRETDKIVTRLKNEDIFWCIEQGFFPTKQYKFVLTERDAVSSIVYVTDSITPPQKLGLIKGKMIEGQRHMYAIVGYRRHTEDGVMELAQDAFIGHKYFHDLNPFVRIYVVDNTSQESERIVQGTRQRPERGKYVLIIEDINSLNQESREPFLYVMRLVYSASQSINPKTPSET